LSVRNLRDAARSSAQPIPLHACGGVIVRTEKLESGLGSGVWALEGPGGLRRAPEGSGGLRRAPEGSGGLRRAPEGSGGLRTLYRTWKVRKTPGTG